MNVIVMASLFDHTERFYQALYDASELESLDGVETRIYRGKVTDLYKSLSISQTHYSNIRSALIDLGCMVMVRQGARDFDTVIALYRKPEKEVFEARQKNPLTRRVEAASMIPRIEALEKSIGGIDTKKALIEIQRQINAMQDDLNEMKREVDKLAERKKKSTGITY